MKYEDWVKCRVYISDLRPFGDEFDAESSLHPGELYSQEPVPGYVFVQNGVKRLSENMGYMLVFDGKIHVTAETDEYVGGMLSSTVEVENATRWLWEHWAKYEYGDKEPTLRFIYFERDNAEETYNVIVSERSFQLAVYKAIDDFWRAQGYSDVSELNKQEAVKSLFQSNIYEFQGGHLVAIPLG